MMIYNILCQPPSSSTSEDYSAAPSASLTIHDLLICHIVLKARLLFLPLSVMSSEMGRRNAGGKHQAGAGNNLAHHRMR